MKKKFLSVVLATAMVMSLCSCGAKEQAPAASSEAPVASVAEDTTTEESVAPEIGADGTAAVSEDIPLVGNIACEMPIVSAAGNNELNILIHTTAAGYEDSTKVKMWNDYEDLSGVHVNWTEAGSDRKATVQQALIGEEDYDVILKCKIGQETLVDYGDQGYLIDLATVLPEYAPNVWAYLQNHPDTKACITTPEGNIWSLPQVNSGAELRVSRKIFMNQTWLDNLGLEIPTTTDEIYNVLKAFKEQDANGNGDATDEIPLSTGDWASLQDIFLGAFGLGTRGQHNQVVDWDTENNCIRLIGISDGYKDMLQYLNKLYTEGLLDQEQFAMGKTWTVKQADNRVGMFGNTNLAGITVDNGCEWTGIKEAIEGPNGDKLWAPIRANFHSVGNFMIPATCKDVELACKWIDYFWTDEGCRFYHYGTLGEDCVALDDGTYAYADSVLAPMATGASFDNCAAAISPYPGGSNPCPEIVPYFGGGETAPEPAATARALFDGYKTDEFWPEFTFTLEESAELSSIKTDVTKAINDATPLFITGEKSFDEWDAYVESIKNMGSDRMLEIYQAAVDRYHALMK